VALVATPEEMAVAETMEALPVVAATGIPLAAVLVNRRTPPVFPRGVATIARSLDPARAARLATDAGAPVGAADTRALMEDARTVAARHRRERHLVEELAAAGTLVELPDLSDTPPEDRVAALAGRLSPGGGGPGGRHLDGAAPRKRPTTDPAGGAAEEASPGADRPRPLADQRLGHALAETRIVVVCGSGGVGKTT